jgi:hypothetical protein
LYSLQAFLPSKLAAVKRPSPSHSHSESNDKGDVPVACKKAKAKGKEKAVYLDAEHVEDDDDPYRAESSF